MKKLFALLSSILLVGCATSPSLIENIKKDSQHQVQIDAEIMKNCSILTSKLNPGESFERTLVLRAEDIKSYYECYLLNEKKREIIQRYLLNERQK